MSAKPSFWRVLLGLDGRPEPASGESATVIDAKRAEIEGLFRQRAQIRESEERWYGDLQKAVNEYGSLSEAAIKASLGRK